MTAPATACLFCRIVAGELHADVVAESPHAIAFRDITPVAPTHILVVPRRHIDDAAGLEVSDAELLIELVALAQGVAESEGISTDGYRLVFNVGRDGGNTVAHLHLHVLGGRAMAWPPG